MVIFALILAAALIGLDQVIKLWAIQSVAPVGTIPIIPDVLHFTYVENYGAAFSIMQNKKWFLIGVTSIVIIAALVVLLSGKIKNRFLIATIALILAGGAGNLLDRVFRGYVVDYIDFRLINFPVFNFADCCVVIGTILLAIFIVFFDSKPKAEKKLPQEPTENGEAQGG